MKYKNQLINGIILFTGDNKSHGRSLGQTFSYAELKKCKLNLKTQLAWTRAQKGPGLTFRT